MDRESLGSRFVAATRQVPWRDISTVETAAGCENQARTTACPPVVKGPAQVSCRRKRMKWVGNTEPDSSTLSEH